MREASLILGNRRRVWAGVNVISIDGVRSFNIALQVANDKGPGSMYILRARYFENKCEPGRLSLTRQAQSLPQHN